MSFSRRKAIRDAVRAKLLGATDAKQNVFTNQASASWNQNLPLIAIYTRSEDVELFAVSPREYKRTLQLMIEVIASGSENATGPDAGLSCEDALDAICVQIEDAMAPDETFGEIDDPRDETKKKKVALVDETLLQGIEFAFRAEGETPEAAAVMRYNMVYHAYEQPPVDETEGLGSFEKANVEWPIGETVPGHTQQENFEIEDDLTIPD